MLCFVSMITTFRWRFQAPSKRSRWWIGALASDFMISFFISMDFHFRSCSIFFFHSCVSWCILCMVLWWRWGWRDSNATSDPDKIITSQKEAFDWHHLSCWSQTIYNLQYFFQSWQWGSRVAIRNPQSNQIQFVWTFNVFYRMPCDRTWRGDQVSCDWCSKCSKVKISWAKFTAAFWFNLGSSRIVRCMTSYLLGFDSRAVLLRDLRDLCWYSPIPNSMHLAFNLCHLFPPLSGAQYWWVQTSCSQWGQRSRYQKRWSQRANFWAKNAGRDNTNVLILSHHAACDGWYSPSSIAW